MEKNKKKQFKIAFVGKICSGKTTLSKYIKMVFPCMVKLSFADKIKEIAHDLFDMKEKDRKLLQDIGTNMRSICPDVFTNYLIKQSKKYDYVCVDDARFLNEISALKKNGFYIVKLNISLELQLERLINTYPTTYKEHIKRFSHQSETEMDKVDCKIFDLIINVDDNNYKELDKLCSLHTGNYNDE